MDTKGAWLPGSCVIAGIGETSFMRNSGRSELSLAMQVVTAAVRDAGLKLEDVDGFISCCHDKAVWPRFLALNLGVRNITYWAESSSGESATCATIAQAVAAINAGLAQTIVVYR